MHTLDWNQIHSFETEKFLPTLLTPLTELPIIVMVGLTGVGKTTTLELLANSGLLFTLLPNRRKVTDKVMIASLQRDEGKAPYPVTDRVARFDYTARYRAKHPGAMAYALSHLAVDTTDVTFPFIFDGLRGLDEVRQATVYFSRARFIILDAPDTIRLGRLLKRADAFDTTASQPSTNRNDLISVLLATPNIETIFRPDELNQIARMAQDNHLSNDEIVQKVSIIIKERLNYDSAAARTYLIDTLSPKRLLVIDTAAQPPHTVVEQIAAWLAVTP